MICKKTLQELQKLSCTGYLESQVQISVLSVLSVLLVLLALFVFSVLSILSVLSDQPVVIPSKCLQKDLLEKCQYQHMKYMISKHDFLFEFGALPPFFNVVRCTRLMRSDALLSRRSIGSCFQDIHFD